ncbi:MAG TPA: CFI-box-CTERM domain-containing protein [Nitrosopumilaceae archaeon]|nr:CFI-box-CTERM domain-containing protein [Nitrosopumilaceae archaeon]
MALPVYAQEQSEETVLPTDKGTINVGLSTIPDQPNPSQETKLKINFLNKNTNMIQEHIDYSITVKKGESQVFSIPLTHTAIGSVTIPYQFEIAGQYQVSVDIQGILFQPIPTESAVFSISVVDSQSKNGCLIATAAFGSELAPQVQFLREYRDNTVMTTVAGSSFLNVFNAVYYSFSPTVADVERNNPFLQESVRIGIMPLLGILQVTETLNTGGEISVVISGIIASLLVGAIYLWPAGLITRAYRKSLRSSTKFVIIIISIVIALTLISIATANVQFMAISTSIMILALAGAGAIFSSQAIWKAVLKIRSTFL